jgi:hypothetical protein
MEDMYE